MAAKSAPLLEGVPALLVSIAVQLQTHCHVHLNAPQAFAQPSAFGALGGNGMANGAGNPLQAGAAQAGLAGQQGNGNGMYEAMGPADVQKMNAAYILRNQPALIGAHLRQQGAS